MGDGTADADLSTKLDNLLKLVEDHASAIQQIKGQYSTLNVAVNRLQTKALDLQPQQPSSSFRSPPESQPLAPITHKLCFPEYKGKEDPVPWLHKCEQFFRAYRMPETGKVWTASFYMSDTAQRWYFRLERNRGIPTWPDFVDLVSRRFGPPIRSNPLGELAQLHRTGTVEDFQDQFLTLLARCDDVTEAQQVALFTAGLGGTLGIDIEIQRPTTLEDAMNLARAYERRAVTLGSDSKPTSSRAPPRVPTAP